MSFLRKVKGLTGYCEPEYVDATDQLSHTIQSDR